MIFWLGPFLLVFASTGGDGAIDFVRMMYRFLALALLLYVGIALVLLPLL